MYNLIENKIIDIANNYFNYFMRLDNVIGVGLGCKFINGINTRIPCIHVLVKKKIKINYINISNIIPKTYMGIITDVIEVGIFKSNQATLLDKVRPLECGYGISAFSHGKYLGFGTITCILSRIIDNQKEFYILSNNHVLAGNNTLAIGTPILQPSDLFGGDEEADIIATLANFIPLRFHNEKSTPVNLSDSAIAKIIDKNIISSKLAVINQNILGISKVLSSLSTISNLSDIKVKKIGAFTSLTEGTIDTINATIEFEALNNKLVTFKNQIVATCLVGPGDSGAVLLDGSNEIIGMLIGGDDEFGVYTDINTILNLYKAELYF